MGSVIAKLFLPTSSHQDDYEKTVKMWDSLFEQIVGTAMSACEFRGRRITLADSLCRLDAQKVACRTLCEVTARHASSIPDDIKALIMKHVHDDIKTWPEYLGPHVDFSVDTSFARCAATALDQCEFHGGGLPDLDLVGKYLIPFKVVLKQSIPKLNVLWHKGRLPKEVCDDEKADSVIKRLRDLETDVSAMMLTSLRQMKQFHRLHEDGAHDIARAVGEGEGHPVQNVYDRYEKPSTPSKFTRFAAISLTDKSLRAALLEDLGLYQPKTIRAGPMIVRSVLAARITRIRNRLGIGNVTNTGHTSDDDDSQKQRKIILDDLDNLYFRAINDTTYRLFRGKDVKLRFNMLHQHPGSLPSLKQSPLLYRGEEVAQMLVIPSFEGRRYVHGSAVQTLKDGVGFITLYESGAYTALFVDKEYTPLLMNKHLASLHTDLIANQRPPANPFDPDQIVGSMETLARRQGFSVPL